MNDLKGRVSVAGACLFAVAAGAGAVYAGNWWGQNHPVTAGYARQTVTRTVQASEIVPEPYAVTHSAVGPTSTQTVPVPGPATTRTVRVPGPTVTQTVTSPAPGPSGGSPSPPPPPSSPPGGGSQGGSPSTGFSGGSYPSSGS